MDPSAAAAAAVSELSDKEVLEAFYDWEGRWARPEQLAPPGDWYVWLALAGRGWGKTRTGAEWLIKRARERGGKRLAVVGATAADVRDVMVEGESGIMACSPPDFPAHYEPSNRRITWPNGTTATTFSAEKPDALRGPQFDDAWADEIAKWRYSIEAWDNLMFGLRLGDDPRCMATTTPKPKKIIRDLLGDPSTVVTRGSTYANRANLARQFFAKVVRKYAGTAIGRQELDGELLDQAVGALWQRAWLEKLRVTAAPTLVRLVVGVDPPAGDGKNADGEDDGAEAGIVVEGISNNGHLYTLADLSKRGSPEEWGKRAVDAYKGWKADVIVAEANQGGDMVRAVIHAVDPNVPVKLVHASRGKRTRAEPVSMRYEQGRAHHVGAFPELEDQMCNWVPGEESPDRMDAKVWASTELMGNDDGVAIDADPSATYAGDHYADV